MMTKRKCFIHGQYEGETCPQCENAALPPVRSEPLLAAIEDIWACLKKCSHGNRNTDFWCNEWDAMRASIDNAKRIAANR